MVGKKKTPINGHILYEYTFDSLDDCIIAKKMMRSKREKMRTRGLTREVFLNNAWGFEFKPFEKADINITIITE